MNCLEFTQLAPEIARHRLMEASARCAALAHADACKPCAARLERETAVSGGLRLFAEVSRAERNAPERVETALLAALRAQQAQPVAVTPLARRRVVWGPWAAVAAALLLALLPLAYWRSGTREAPQTAFAWQPIAPGFAEWPLPQAVKEEKTIAQKPPVVAPKLLQAVAYRAAPPVRKVRPAQANRPRRQEIATDYFALSEAEGLPQTDSYEVVRVKLPRSAMASFGLPVGANAANSQVTADVIIGADGLARAVRFVR
jgi:hypothetical protein